MSTVSGLSRSGYENEQQLDRSTWAIDERSTKVGQDGDNGSEEREDMS